jgi:hypothetical protein
MTPSSRAWLFLVAAAAAGCGGDPPEDGDEPFDPPPAPVADAAPTGEKPKFIAWMASRSPGVTLVRDEQQTRLDAGGEIRSGDSLRVPADGRADLEFDCGGGLWLLGPAALSVGELSATGRRFHFQSGSITRAKAQGVAIEIQTGYDVSLVLQNCKAAVAVSPEKVEFQRLTPGYAKVWRDSAQAFEDLGDAPFVVEVAPAAPK